MDKGDDNSLRRPLLPATTSSAAATSSLKHETDIHNDHGIIQRLLFVTLIGTLSVWAHHEASRGFRITVVNDAGDSPAGRRFHLLFVSDDEATRTVVRATEFADNVLYSDRLATENRVGRVILRLGRHNLSDAALAVESVEEGEFCITLCPSLMIGETATDVRRNVAAAVRRGVARMRLSSNNHLMAPRWIVAGIVEYVGLSGLDSGGDWLPAVVRRDDPIAVAHLLKCCERQREGFIRWLVGALEEEWTERTVDDGARVEMGQCSCMH